MNKSDSERIATVLENSGFKKSSLEKANYAFLNLCSVRQSAIDRVWGKTNQIKKNNKSAKIILTGCILPSEKNKFLKKAYLILDIKDLDKWPDILCPTKKTQGHSLFACEQQNQDDFVKFVPIMTGCDKIGRAHV